MANVYVRRLQPGEEIVKTIEVGNPNPREHERFMLGLLRNMDTEHFYADDSEVDWPSEQEDRP